MKNQKSMNLFLCISQVPLERYHSQFAGRSWMLWNHGIIAQIHSNVNQICGIIASSQQQYTE